MALWDEIKRRAAVDRRSPLQWLGLAASFALGVSLFATDSDWLIFTVMTCAVLALLCAGCLAQAWRSLAARRARGSA